MASTNDAPRHSLAFPNAFPDLSLASKPASTAEITPVPRRPKGTPASAERYDPTAIPSADPHRGSQRSIPSGGERRPEVHFRQSRPSRLRIDLRHVHDIGTGHALSHSAAIAVMACQCSGGLAGLRAGSISHWRGSWPGAGVPGTGRLDDRVTGYFWEGVVCSSAFRQSGRGGSADGACYDAE
jgi:hypothetical protein